MRRDDRGTGPRREAGFAMLFVFLMAAAAALLFYRELPRIAFERQREKEQLLIERGEQYRRAIQLYVRKFNRYPAELSQLEKTSEVRFLRRRYKDPMTGKDEWRLIHAGPGGVLLDSLLNKPGGSETEKLDSKEAAQVSGEAEAEQPTTPGLRRRPSEMPGMYPGAVAMPGMAPGMVAGQQPGLYPGAAVMPGVAPGMIPGGQAGVPGGELGQPPVYQIQPGGVVAPGQPPAYPVQAGAAGTPDQSLGPGAQPGIAPGYVPGQAPELVPNPPTEPGQRPAIVIPGGQLPTYPLVPIPQAGRPQAGQTQAAPYPTQNVPGLPGPYGQPGVPSFGAITIAPGAQPGVPPYSTQPGVGGAPMPGQQMFPQPGFQPAPGQPGQNPAIQMIRDILTKPRPGGLAGIQQQTVAPGGQIIGGGIAGVASTLEAEGIMVYNDRTKYNEWEFVYDIRKDPLKMGQVGQAALAPGTQIDSGKMMRRTTSEEELPAPGRRQR